MINPNAELEKAQDCLRSGDFKRALKLSKGLSRAVPKSPVPLNIAGIALTGLNKPADSLSYFKKAIAIEPGFHDARKNAAQALVSMGKPDKALQWLEVPKKQTPGDPVVWYLMTQCRMGLNQPDKAMEAVNTVIDLQPGQARGYFLRARVFLQIGYLRDAISDLEKVLEIDPSNIAAMTEISLPLARQLRSDEALAVVEKAVSLQPDASAARLRLASQLVETGRGPEAVQQYQEVLKSDHGNAFALESLVELLDGDDVAGLEEAAMRALKSAPRRSEERATLQYALYRILLGQERGPRFGSFAALYGVRETAALIASALDGSLYADNN